MIGTSAAMGLFAAKNPPRSFRGGRGDAECSIHSDACSSSRPGVRPISNGKPVFSARHEPLMGRGLTPEDDRPGATPVVLLSYRAWQRVFFC
jgi:hypothetical protein